MNEQFMTHAYPQIKDLALQNVQKCYAVIIDNPCDPKTLSALLYLLTFLRCFLKFSKILFY